VLIISVVFTAAHMGSVAVQALPAQGAEVPDALLRLGFGFVEIGSVTAKPSKGNPRPRTFRLPEDRAIVNRMGLNNAGALAIAQRLQASNSGITIPMGVNIAKTPDNSILGPDAVEDFRHSFHMLAPLVDYVTLNVSCPNTADGKTFEDADALDGLLQSIFVERKAQRREMPVFLKLSPPVSARIAFDSRLDEMVAVARSHGVAGFVATNTAPDRLGVQASDRELERIGAGGLSGPPLAERSTRSRRSGISWLRTSSPSSRSALSSSASRFFGLGQTIGLDLLSLDKQISRLIA
jgi:dihydroorotate dehydrogenase